MRFDCVTISRWAAVLALAALAGCAAPRALYSPPEIQVNRPEIGVLTTASPGDPLIEQVKLRDYEAISLASPFALRAFVLPAGAYIKESESSVAEFFAWDEVTRPTQGGIVSDGNTLKHVLLFKGSAAVCAEVFSGRLYCESSAPVERVRVFVADQRTLQRTLLYSGKVGTKINLSYREFANGMARQAFTNTAEYDLSESKVIGYQGAQIEVVEASNQAITYRVLRSFNPPK